jgi:hypothetical protein
MSRQGHKIAVGFAGSIRVYDGATGNFEPFPGSRIPKERLPLTVDSQCISFSVDATHLVVATRETREGHVYTCVYDLQPASRSAQQMPTIRIPSVRSNSLLKHSCTPALLNLPQISIL